MIIRNEQGSVIIIAVMVLALLTIIGISSMKTSIIEQQISTNHLIYQMNFYAAESGAPHGSLWLKTLDLKDDTDKDWFMPLDADDNQEWFELSNKTKYTWKVQHQVNADGDILYYGDANNDYMWEVNTTTGMPLEIIDAEGTHPRGGLARIRTTWIYQPSFPAPQAALFGHALIEKSGGSGTIEGADHSGSGCSNVADIATDGVNIDSIEVKDMVLDDDGVVDVRTAQPLYPVPLFRDVLLKRATEVVVGEIDKADFFEGILFAYPDADGNIDAKKLSGKGILFVDGNLEVGGGIGWEGMIIVNGEIRVNGGGGLTTTGSVAAWGDVLLNGSVAIKYDCEVISNLLNEYSGYRMTSWRQM